MSVLKSLKLSNAAPVAAANDPLHRARDKLLGALTDQRAYATATVAGEHYTPPKNIVSRKNEAGERVRMEANRRIRKGWFQDGAGTVHFQVYVGGKPMELAKGKQAVEVGTLDKLPSVIDQLIEAVRAGELDAQIATAAEARGLMMAERRKPRAA
ncbi:hypothetical protein ASF58_16305 [Methylobacterium sp. Leaf125]|uniref:hypothetical protein n=1 Tax=Methylobacterium sp. Leaf125 TaxID=1736265 RepID=UPI0006F82F5D|nr:hypothetical protein [Methylobacterium sp. Leaf125]KQQ24145.1 hypothetical protein ASF58_16305 [Methylobacterium sp. Leaf125]